VSVFTQIIAKTPLAATITSVDIGQFVDYGLDAISVAALAYSAHARFTKPMPSIKSG